MDPLAQRKIYSVQEVTAEIKKALDHFGVLWVQGEISNFKHHTSGHMYFSLKDDRAQLRAACFRNNNLHLKFRPEDGLEVLVRGRISVYEPRGDYQILVESMEPVGLGSLQLAFEQLKQKLRDEGLFDESHKVRLPLLPRKVGIVTSPTGAAIQDILRILDRRNASLDILIYPARVQGAGAAEEIAAGVKYFNGRDDIDVIIVARGGGSMEDLWAFNEEVVARAIYAAERPVISAVGHEVDFTIADFVADLRAPTPSAAAEVVSGARDDLRATVNSLTRRALQAARLLVAKRRSALERAARNRAFNIAPNKVRELQQRFDEATLKTTQSMLRYQTGLRHASGCCRCGCRRWTSAGTWRATGRFWQESARACTRRPAGSCSGGGPAWNWTWAGCMPSVRWRSWNGAMPSAATSGEPSCGMRIGPLPATVSKCGCHAGNSAAAWNRSGIEGSIRRGARWI